MKDLTLNDWSALAQIVIALITFIGIVASLWYSRKALKEIQLDRKLRQLPHLAFETGGMMLPVCFEAAGKHIPGVNPKYVEKALPNLPASAESVRIKEDIRKDGTIIKPIFFGKLRNYGMGPALSTDITWVPITVWIGSEKFTLDENKLSEPIYGRPLNHMPAIPRHILPGQEAALSRLPTFIEKDFEKKVTKVDGKIEIQCEDIFRQKHHTYQKFHFFTDYKAEKPTVIVTFSDIISQDEYDEMR